MSVVIIRKYSGDILEQLHLYDDLFNDMCDIKCNNSVLTYFIDFHSSMLICF